jgi:hypothetical protein
MYGRLQEDVAWTRLQDMQREMENRRFGSTGEPLTGRIIRSAGSLLRQAAESAVQRVARRDPAPQLEPCDAVQEVA